MKQKFPEPTVGALIFNRQGKLLLVNSPKWFDKYTIPGGHVELGENMETALKREVKEEVGLDIEVKGFLNWQEAIYSEEFYKPKHFVLYKKALDVAFANIKRALNSGNPKKFLHGPVAHTGFSRLN